MLPLQMHFLIILLLRATAILLFRMSVNYAGSVVNDGYLFDCDTVCSKGHC